MPKTRDMYKDAGIDLEQNEIANRWAKLIIPETHNETVIDDLDGLFSTGIRIDRDKGDKGDKGEKVGQLWVSADTPAEMVEGMHTGISKLLSRGDHPVAITDYIAYGQLIGDVAGKLLIDVVAGSRKPDGTHVPVIGGEFAEMPGVIKKRGLEFTVVINYQSHENRRNSLSIRNHKGDILVYSKDSVGTKTELGQRLGIQNGLFFDMIGHSVGDVVVQGTTPLGIGMYVGSAPDFSWPEMEKVFQHSARESLLTNMGFHHHSKKGYCKERFDIIGNITGIVDEDKLLTGHDIKEGDYLIGIKSFGVNTNGYSLVRKLVSQGLLKVDEMMPGTNMTVGQALMEPHQNYWAAMNDSRKIFGADLKGAAHITGSGIEKNTNRLFPDGLKAEIHSLPENSRFRYIQEIGRVNEETMGKTFNRGIGVMLAVDKGYDVNNLPDRYHLAGKVVSN